MSAETGVSIAVATSFALAVLTSCTTHVTDVHPTTTVVATTTITATATSTVTSLATVTASSVGKPVDASPARQPQGTVTITFQNDSSNRQNCSNTTVFVHNQSDTPLLSISVVFRPRWTADVHGSVRTEPEPLTAARIQPAGIAAFQSGAVNFAICVGPPKFSIAHANFASVDAVPTTFTWEWEH